MTLKESQPDMSALPSPTNSPRPDPLRSVVFERRAPDAVLGKVKTDMGVAFTPVAKVADSPINYLFLRLPESKRIDEVQYAAAIRFREDHNALARVGSNTQAVINHMVTLPVLTAEDRARLKAGDQCMKSSGMTYSRVDPSAGMLAAAFRVRRYTERLDALDAALLVDLLVRESTVGQIAVRWSWSPEAMGYRIREALWRLANVTMAIDAEFSAWVSDQRQAENPDK